MYRAFYGLEKKPFQISADPAFLWLGPKHKEGLSILLYGVSDNKGFLVLSGGVGTGKTTLIHALLRQLDDKVVVASVPDPGLTLIEFYQFIATSFGMKGRFKSKVDFLFAFETFLKKMHAQGRNVLLIIDEAQRLNAAMLDEIRLLSNIELPEQKLLNIFFVGQEEFLRILSAPRHRALKQRITINHHLSPLSPEETRMLIDHRLQVAGATRPIFDDEAIRGIYAFSRGHPRRIIIICDHALLTGFVAERPTIGADIIAECASELRLPGERPGPPPPPPKDDTSPKPSTPQPEKPSSIPANSTAPAILGEAILDAPAPAPAKPPRFGRERLFTVVTALLVTILAAFIYFKPPTEVASPPIKTEVASAPPGGTVVPNPAMTAPIQKLPSDPENGVPAAPTLIAESVDELVAQPPTSESDKSTRPGAPPQDRAITANLDDTLPGTRQTSAGEAGSPASSDRVSGKATVTPPLSATKAKSRTGETTHLAAVSRTLPETTAAPDPPATALPSSANASASELSPESSRSPIDRRALQVESLSTVSNVTRDNTQRAPEEAPSPQKEIIEDVLSAEEGSVESGMIAPAPPVSARPTATPARRPSLSTRGDSSGSQNGPTSDENPAATTRPSNTDPAVTPPIALTRVEQPSPAQNLSAQERLKKFLEIYCEAYSARDLDRFRALFTHDAIERGKPFSELIPVYRTNFERLAEIRYWIDLESYEANADGSEVSIEGDFKMQYRMRGQDWNSFDGAIEMDLISEDNRFRVKRLDYQKRN